MAKTAHRRAAVWMGHVPPRNNAEGSTMLAGKKRDEPRTNWIVDSSLKKPLTVTRQ